jgi:hypothetical protein
MITPALMMDMDDTIIDRIWIAGLASCLVLSWWLSGGNLFLTGITLLLPIGAWLLFGWYRWALLLPLSLMGLLALIGAFYLW